MLTLQQAMERRQNNFHLCRMIGALFIIFAHSILIGGMEQYYTERDPQFRWALILMGKNALRLFFVFSGIMVAMSLDRRSSLSAYAAARLMRIVPPLLLFSAVMVFVIGPLMTSLPVLDYFSRLDTWLFVPKAASGLFVPGLPGMFEAVTRSTEVNASLWTLVYEVVCYIVLALLWAAGWLAPRRLPLTLAAVAALYLGITFGTDLRLVEPVEATACFGISFMIGVAVYHYRRWIPVSLWLVALLGGVTVLVRGTPWAEPASILTLTLAGLWLALVPKGWILGYGRVGELSYSTYIWHWPIGQILISLWPGLLWPQLFLLMVLITLPVAFLSWTLVELPALRRIPAAAILIRRLAEALRLVSPRVPADMAASPSGSAR
ncbi:acyltransferase [Inquilinus sp. Marseille-Q2685]|uniref:acyltransferase family protein n=1 Tax=Inquilinus sp. Marseille-Q2685 TaxID=2866581 RepID=UPI001CE41C3B|nr:acyltransferase [Inquilinus sp. Marseille-Q2685]